MFAVFVSGKWLIKVSYPALRKQAGNMSTHLIANMLSSIKNASLAGKKEVEVPYSKICESIAKVLKDTGYLAEVKVFKEKESAGKSIKLGIAYKNEIPVLRDIKMRSKPGRRIYKGADELGSVAGGYGTSVVSTSRGIMRGQEARKKRLGGELICEVL